MIELDLKKIILKATVAIAIPLATISILNKDYMTPIINIVLVLALLPILIKIIKRIRPYPLFIHKEYANLPNIIFITLSVLLTVYLLFSFGYLH